MPEAFRSRTISIGSLTLGGDAPVRLQSMTNTDTNDVEASADQCIRMIRAGAELVRLTTQGSREVLSLKKIRDRLRSRGWNVPVVADIHFKPELALEAARVADKIRINPGNYLRGAGVGSLLPELLRTCTEEGTALRIGVNHGSLEESILQQYGDTPAGMVESAMRFLRVCRKEGFDRVVVSMVQSVRLLASLMAREGMDYPLHLGVTEAGDGLEGRIRSVAGLAPLLAEGLGDTIRVSLTEAPENELPVARQILELFPRAEVRDSDPFSGLVWDPFSFRRRVSMPVLGMGNGSRVKIISKVPPQPGEDLTPEQVGQLGVPYAKWQARPSLLDRQTAFLLLEKGREDPVVLRSRLNEFCLRNQRAPIVYKTLCGEPDPERFSLQVGGELAMFLVDGNIDAVWVESPVHSPDFINDTLLTILQVTHARISKTEYIACPSCGRTHFDIQARLKEIRQATSHLKHLRIGVMGCIVNGPGEMADADYGYVGAGKGRITLYRRKEAVRHNLPEDEALDALLQLIREEGDWYDPGEGPA
jgi:(E)-4-hydroxy-3-methylbut-2-enyl-diphosphate synthase